MQYPQFDVLAHDLFVARQHLARRMGDLLVDTVEIQSDRSSKNIGQGGAGSSGAEGRSGVSPCACCLSRLALIVGIVAGLLSAADGAKAQEAAKPGWQFYITPYFWASSLAGTVGTPNPERPTQTATAGFGDVLSHLSNIPVMATLEARNGRFGVLSDLMVISLRTPVSTPGPLFSGVTAQTTQFVTTEMGMYRVLRRNVQWLDVGVGFRTAAIWTKLTFNPGIIPGFTAKSAVAWADPLFGARYHVNLSKRIGLTAYADVGDLPGGSTLTWEVLGMADYRYNDWLIFHAGYRHLHMDWSGSTLSVGVALSGPFLAATFQF